MIHSLLAAFVWILPVALLAQQSGPRRGRRARAGEARHDAAGRVDPSVARVVDALVEQLRQESRTAGEGAGRVGVLLIDASGGDATLIAEEMDARLIRCGSPAWSGDGKRILFDATPGNKDYMHVADHGHRAGRGPPRASRPGTGRLSGLLARRRSRDVLPESGRRAGRGRRRADHERRRVGAEEARGIRQAPVVLQRASVPRQQLLGRRASRR